MEQMELEDRANRIREVSYGLAMLSSLIMLLAGFLMHPELG